MIKPSGAWCDICENPILLGTVFQFGMQGLKNTFHSCEECKDNFSAGKTILDWPDCEAKRQIIKISKDNNRKRVEE